MLIGMKDILSARQIKSFFIWFGFYWGLSLFLRFFNDQFSVDLVKYQGYALSSGVLFVLSCFLWRFQKSYIMLHLLIGLLYVSVAYMKFWQPMALLEREVIQSFAVGIILFSLYSLVLYVAKGLKSRVLSGIIYIVADLYLGLVIFLPLFVWGYFVVSGGKMLDADIVLTFFQTNLKETLDYVKEQNVYMYVLLYSFTFVVIALSWIIGARLTIYRNVRLFVVTSVMALFLMIGTLPRLDFCYFVNLGKSVYTTLNSYSAFKEGMERRLQRLDDLRASLKTADKGIYMLVIGEATTRNHMHVYGYQRLTTPWMDVFSVQPQTIVFQNAYSNHVHTIPALTYALSEQNQYSEKKLADAYSIMEVARAAGFKTYWLSNQPKFSVADTPLTSIAKVAENEVWLNTFIGHKTGTLFYDEVLAEKIPDLSGVDKALIVVHLMGCHNQYQERYYDKFDVFGGTDERVDTYDNNVLYNDYVLEKLYDRVRALPNFMAWIYFSDHGEEADNHLSHESTKFTFQMARIPLVIGVSDKFVGEYQEKFEILKQNKGKYWTNDLLYDLMLDIMDIKGLDNKYENSLASEKYKFDKDLLFTLHGKKNIADDE